MSDIFDILELLHEAQGMAEVVEEFAHIHLEQHREALTKVLAFQRREGRSSAFHGQQGGRARCGAA